MSIYRSLGVWYFLLSHWPHKRVRYLWLTSIIKCLGIIKAESKYFQATLQPSRSHSFHAGRKSNNSQLSIAFFSKLAFFAKNVTLQGATFGIQFELPALWWLFAITCISGHKWNTGLTISYLNMLMYGKATVWAYTDTSFNHLCKVSLYVVHHNAVLWCNNIM